MLARVIAVSLAGILWTSTAWAQQPAAAPAAPAAVQVTPYGLLVTNFFYDSNAVNNADVPTLAGPSAGVPDQPSLGATIRQSRFGLRASMPAAASALGATAVEGVFEADFFGGYYPGNNLSWYAQLMPRVRLFYGALNFERVRVVFGQDWMILAPLNPDSLSHMEIAGFSNSGNLWSRVPQARIELKLGPMGVVAGVLAPASGGATTGTTPPVTAALRNPSGADFSMVPSAQARVFWAPDLMGETMTIGVSGHFGLEQVWIPDDPIAPTAFEQRTVQSYAVAADLVVPFKKLLTLRGEFYWGANLDGFFSNANATSTWGPPASAEAVTAWGFWAQLSAKFGDLGVHAGFGMEDPQAPAGFTFASTTVEQNASFYGAVTYALAPKFNVGIQYDRLMTTRGPATAGGPTVQTSANVVALSAHLGF